MLIFLIRYLCLILLLPGCADALTRVRNDFGKQIAAASGDKADYLNWVDEEKRRIRDASQTAGQAEARAAELELVRAPIRSKLKVCGDLIKKSRTCITDTCPLAEAQRVTQDVTTCLNQQRKMIDCTDADPPIGVQPNYPAVALCLKEMK